MNVVHPWHATPYGFQNAACRGPSPGAVRNGLSSFNLRVLSYENTRTRSAPRSGTRIYCPVGSRIASCSCGACCREATGPVWFKLKTTFWLKLKFPVPLRSHELTAEPE